MDDGMLFHIQRIKHRSFKTTIHFLVLIKFFQIRIFFYHPLQFDKLLFQNYALLYVHPFVLNFSDKEIFFTTTFNVNKCLCGDVM